MWITSHSWQQQKTINVSTQIQNYFLSSFSWAVVTSVVSKLSHSDYLNLPVTFDNKKGQSYFCIIANKYGITYLPQLHWSSSNFLSINITAFWLPNGSWQQTSGTPYPPKTAKFWNYVWTRIVNVIITGLSNFFVLKNKGFRLNFLVLRSLSLK